MKFKYALLVTLLIAIMFIVVSCAKTETRFNQDKAIVNELKSNNLDQEFKDSSIEEINSQNIFGNYSIEGYVIARDIIKPSSNADPNTPEEGIRLPPSIVLASENNPSEKNVKKTLIIFTDPSKFNIGERYNIKISITNTHGSFGLNGYERIIELISYQKII